jgi:hypothetical protein
MEYKVNVFFDGKLVEPSDYPKIFISCPAVDRIVNAIYDQWLDGQIQEEDDKREAG